jgi:hypothetical protein
MPAVDAQTQSQLVGRYLRSVVSKRTEHLVHTLAHGTGKPIINPFTQEQMATRSPDAVVALAAELAQRGLNKDPKFMACLAGAVGEMVNEPIRYLLDELAALEEYGDGGPDPEFVLAFPTGEAVSMKAAVTGFGVPDVSANQGPLLAEWPRNANGRAACPCCGYFTLADAPASGEVCPVCCWEDEADPEQPWNMAKWGYIEPPPPGQPDPFGYREMEHITIDVARRNYERIGAYEERYAEFARPPYPEEQPRYDWSKDPRPYWPDQTSTPPRPFGGSMDP